MSPASKNASQAENARRVLDNLRDPVIMIDKDNLITFANLEAEYFFSSSMANLANFRIDEFVGFSNPLLTLIDQVRLAQSPTNE